MAYQIAQHSVIEAQFLGKADGQTTRTVFHWGAVVTAPPITDGLAALGAFIDSVIFQAIITDFLQCCSSDWVFTGVQLQWISPLRFRPVIFDAATIGAGAAGTGPAGMAPSGATGVISFMADAAGRSNQGRRFMPGLPTGYITASELNATGQGVLSALATDALLVPVTATPAVSYYPTLKKSGFTGVQSDRLTTWAIHPPVRYQHRREVGRGE